MYNPYVYQPQFTTMQQTAQPMEIPRVTGEESARNYPIGPNSSVILLDTNDPLIWVVVTDASGFKTVTAYSIAPYKPEKPMSENELKNQLTALTDRLKDLETKFDNFERTSDNAKSDSSAHWKNKPAAQSNQPNGRNG